MKSSLATRIVLVVMAMHAVVLPALYYGISVVVSRNQIDVFIQHVRTLSRNLAEELELGDAIESRQRVLDMLDHTVLNGDGVYAEFIDNGQSIFSNLNAKGVSWPGKQDFNFGQLGDHTYFIEIPISRPGHVASLRLGFDENPTTDQIQLAMRQTVLVLAAYLCIAVIIAAAWGYHFTRPVVRLQLASRSIARGDYAHSLSLESGVRELHDLGGDLEAMRKELVGVNERLRAEMLENERAEERQRKLENRLRHRQRLETVGTLAGGVAHEFNNVLLPIVLYSELALAETPVGSSAYQDLKEVLASASRARDVVNKILTFSRDAGAPKLRAIDLEPVVREALRLFSALIPPTVQLQADLSGPCPQVKADAALTIQVIMNLCTNAYHALLNAEGIVRVELATSMEPVGSDGEKAPREYVVLSVTDNGAGMDAATAERIFEPFFTTRKVGTGTGLGLSVVHGILETFGATITVDTAVGRGTTFKVAFPVADDLASNVPTVEPAPGVAS
ncbi:MAG: HAMP domain-containing protein [Proteobacteria bacterium]|nr:HAMP domain-containing protein [Pseudomonadota bacterium]